AHGPAPWSSGRVSTTRAPASSSRRRRRWDTSNVNADSAYPLAVAAPAVSHGFLKVTASTRRLISVGCDPLAPLCPGSRTTVLPARRRPSLGAVVLDSTDGAGETGTDEVDVRAAVGLECPPLQAASASRAAAPATQGRPSRPAPPPPRAATAAPVRPSGPDRAGGP